MSRAVSLAAKALGAWSLVQRLTFRVPRIFMLHRFATEPAARRMGSSELKQFLDRVSAECDILTVRDVAVRLADPTPLRRPLAAITVDDGYRDFYDIALPILNSRRIPATIFPIAGFIDARSWLWWDALRYLLDAQPSGRLSLNLSERTFNFELGGSSVLESAWTNIADYLVTQNKDRALALEQLESTATRPLPQEPLEDFAPMDWEQLRECESAGIEIGGHSMTHAFLPDLSDDQVQHEIAGAKRLLERHLRNPVTTFAYPNGMPADCTPAIAKAAQTAGFKIALTAYSQPFSTMDRYAWGRWSIHRGFQLDLVLSGVSLLRLSMRAPQIRDPERSARMRPQRTTPAHISDGMPEVSVVIATHNMGQYVCQAVESVLEQSNESLEVIVVDDGSSDGTLDALKRFSDDPRVRVIAQSNQGQPKAKNAGIRAARGRYIAFCDADDFWLPNKLARQLPVLRARPEVGVVYSPVLQLMPDGRMQPLANHPFLRGDVLNEMFVCNLVPFGTAVVRRECLERQGAFDESIPMGIDWDWWLRIATEWEFDYVSEPTYAYRIWAGQMSKNWRGRYDNAIVIMDRFLERNPGVIPPEVIATAYADTYTNLASRHLRHVGLAACAATLARAFSHKLNYWPAWRLLFLMPWYRIRSLVGN